MKENITREAIVVVIDDDASCRTALKELFELSDSKVKLYASGSAFLEDGIPDTTSCLVIDVRLPEKSGLKVQEELVWAQFRCRSCSSPPMVKSQWPCVR